jgi:hypothetical protein
LTPSDGLTFEDDGSTQVGKRVSINTSGYLTGFSTKYVAAKLPVKVEAPNKIQYSIKLHLGLKKRTLFFIKNIKIMVFKKLMIIFELLSIQTREKLKFLGKKWKKQIMEKHSNGFI